ncbi:MAG: PIN domain-containing protein [Luteitalea sp.]|nr:PIN domain-containing protein [Luteitalea sp.]
MGTILIDTSVLVYTCDPRDLRKHQRAIDLLEHLRRTERAVISVQILGEFFSATTRGRAPLLTVADACQRQDELSVIFAVLVPTPAIALEAARGVRVHQLSYWDAQIWATARLNQVPIILTEDQQEGRRLESVRFVNPFVDDFQLDAWF